MSNNPIRVLHVVGSLNRGGIETWLMHVLRHIDRDRFHIDFLVHNPNPGAYDEEARKLGAHVLLCHGSNRPLEYRRNFRRLLKEHGPYKNVIHSHIHHFSGFVMRLAYQAGVPVRIVHCHNDTSTLDAGALLLRQGYLTLMRRWITRYATLKLAVSQWAAAALYGPDWETHAHARLLHCGVDLEPFRGPFDRAGIRQELGIPSNALVLGHIGRFAAQKNHRFLIEIFDEVAKLHPEARLLLLGVGELRSAAERQAAEAWLAGQVIFAGSRPDVPRILSGAVDVFVLPSLYEGLALVAVEAQAAGLPCLLADTITPEASVVPGLVQLLPLSEPPSFWAEAVLKAAEAGRQATALKVVEASIFNIRRGVALLEETYLAALKSTPRSGNVPRHELAAARAFDEITLTP